MKKYLNYIKKKKDIKYYIIDILKQIDDFIKSDLRNVWVSNDLIKIYIRKSMRHTNERQLLPFFDFATIEVDDEFRGQQVFSTVLKRFEEKYPDKNIYIESILSDRFLEYFKKIGFTIKDENNAYKLANV